MELRRTLLTLAIVAGIAIAGASSAASEPDSSSEDDVVTIWDFLVNQGSGSGSDEPPTGPPANPPAPPTTPVIDEDLALRQQLYDSALENGRYVYKCLDGVNCVTPVTPAPAAPAQPTATGAQRTPTITIRDLATFIPSATTLTMEPAHWMLRDAPTNFIARAEQHTVTAPLLGQQADVRFTPIGYTFDYGDGSTKTTDIGGDTWADLGLDEFSETETSHVYTKRGYYDITASAVYVADYRLNGGPWTSVTGTISIPTTHTGRTVTIDTVLVRGTCDEYPEDPGCPGWDPGPLTD